MSLFVFIIVIYSKNNKVPFVLDSSSLIIAMSSTERFDRQIVFFAVSSLGAPGPTLSALIILYGDGESYEQLFSFLLLLSVVALSISWLVCSKPIALAIRFSNVEFSSFCAAQCVSCCVFDELNCIVCLAMVSWAAFNVCFNDSFSFCA